MASTTNHKASHRSNSTRPLLPHASQPNIRISGIILQAFYIQIKFEFFRASYPVAGYMCEIH